MVTKKNRSKLILLAAVVAGGCVVYYRLNPAERAKFKRSLKRNSTLFLLNVIPYGVKLIMPRQQTEEVPGPTPYAIAET
jgi:hypothetical protein